MVSLLRLSVVDIVGSKSHDDANDAIGFGEARSMCGVAYPKGQLWTQSWYAPVGHDTAKVTLRLVSRFLGIPIPFARVRVQAIAGAQGSETCRTTVARTDALGFVHVEVNDPGFIWWVLAQAGEVFEVARLGEEQVNPVAIVINLPGLYAR